MCELLGMNARYSTDMNHSLTLLRPRGGKIEPHADGWGVAFYEGRAARVFKESVPASDSRCLAFIADYNYQSTIAIGHIRRANPPEFGRTLANTHPFSREFGGRSWVFAHNGKLPGLAEDPRFTLERFRPIGDTDSEHAFCFLLDRVARSDEGRLFDASELAALLQEPVAALSMLGEFNFLMSDGVHLVAFANTKLHLVIRICVERSCQQQVVLLATTPLTGEAWRPLERDRIHIFAEGREVAA